MIDILSIFNVTNPVPILLYVIAFFSGAAVMIIELVGTRIVAPYIGTSIFVWTTLIGVIMTSLSLGYAVGGRLADKWPSLKVVSVILFLASLATAGIIYFRHVAFVFGVLSEQPRLSSFITAISLFTPATILLGMITPFIARLSVSSIGTSGKTIGTLYALSTAGSIAGTFAGGIILISLFGSTKILLGVSLLLLTLCVTTGIVSSVKKVPLVALIGVVIILGGVTLPSNIPVPGTLVLDMDTAYRRTWVFDITDEVTGRPTRYFTDTIYGYESGIFLDNPADILFNYVKYYDLASYFNTNTNKVLMIGAGTFTYPTHFINRYPNKTIDAVEIDSKLLDIAKEYFSYIDNPRLKPIHQDGRIYLNTTKDRYDAVLIDAFSSLLTVPFQLSTQETVARIHTLLSENGVVIMNLISAIDGPRGDLLRSEYATYKTIFPYVYIFKVRDEIEDTRPQNLILVALKSKTAKLPPFVSTDAAEQTMLNHYRSTPIATAPILTDNFAPVEKFVAKMMVNN